MIFLSAKNKFFINIVSIIIITAAVFIFITYPTIKEIKSFSQEIYNYRLYLEKLYLEGQVLKNIVRELKEVEPHLEELSEVLIDKKEELNFIISLEKLANNSELIQDLKINPSQEVSKNTYKILPVQITLQGNYSQLIKYLTEINKLNYYINIKHLSINKIGGASKINVSIEANTYWEK